MEPLHFLAKERMVYAVLTKDFKQPNTTAKHNSLAKPCLPHPVPPFLPARNLYQKHVSPSNIIMMNSNLKVYFVTNYKANHAGAALPDGADGSLVGSDFLPV